MHIIRPFRENDLDALLEIAKGAGPGMTSLPADRDFLIRKIERSLKSFNDTAETPSFHRYLFALEESTTGEVGGCCGIEAAIGLDEPFYSYHIGMTVHASAELGVYSQVPTLYLSNDMTGTSMMCSLYLDPRFRASGTGHLLSKSRFLFMAGFPNRFSPKVIAEMRGYTDENLRSPFWEGVGRHFFNIPFAEADANGSKACIAELMPRHPIYTVMLPEETRDTMGRVHPMTEPALRMLKQEGFRFQNYIDIFDGGATVEAPLTEIRTIRHSQIVRLQAGTVPDDAPRYLVSNEQFKNFRCLLTPTLVKDGFATISGEAFEALMLEAGKPARISPL